MPAPTRRPHGSSRAEEGDLPWVSVVVPCRNEERSIGRCLDAILRSDYPADRLEVLVVDGQSEDGTRRIVEDHARDDQRIRLLTNSARTIPAGMNLSIRHARGAILAKMDAHSECPPDYVRTCVWYLLNYGADNVGGVCRIVAAEDTLMAAAIARVLSHPFGSGNAYVKVGASTPRWTDTVAFGCYRKEIFERIGQWNEHLAGSSDLDINARLRAAGGKILLVPDIVVDYQADRTLAAFWAHNFADGVWATYVMKFGSRAWSGRHWIPLALVLGMCAAAAASLVEPRLRWMLGGLAGSYALATLAASIHLAWRTGRWQYALVAPLVFSVRHLAHGAGAFLGLFLAILPGAHWRGRRTKGA